LIKKKKIGMKNIQISLIFINPMIRHFRIKKKKKLKLACLLTKSSSPTIFIILLGMICSHLSTHNF
jgi:uncharacterized membrane protein YesL